jgi:hypothetical protein
VHTPAPPPEPGTPPTTRGAAAIPDAGLEGDVPPDPEVPPEEQDRPEPSKGTGLLVGGIILTAAATVMGGIAYLNVEPKNYCNGSADNTCAGRARSWGTNVALATLVADGLGVWMIVDGARDRGEWKLWQEERREEKQAAVRFGLTPLAQGGAAGVMALRF